jgi:tetraacyldisaccharide 4'-kinase
MVDGRRMFGNRKLLPAGPLRESFAALERAHTVIINKADQLHPDFAEQAAELLPRIPTRRIFFAAYHISGFRTPNNNLKLSPTDLGQRPLTAVAGLGNNDYFFTQLENLGLELQAKIAFNDHHNYTRADLKRLKRQADDGLLLTTTKDYVKLAQLAIRTGEKGFLDRLLATEIELEIREQERFLELFQPLMRELYPQPKLGLLARK